LDFEDLDYYELLGVPRTASTDEIKRAFRREISKYHPDRFVSASSEEQAYAQRRSQRLTEAHSVLTDFQSRNAYNRGQTPAQRRGTTPRSTPAATPARDHQAELYDQAQAHLAGGRPLQANAALRQLQQINPFYRDTADLLAQAESQLHTRQGPNDRQNRRILPLLIGGGIAVVAIAAAVTLLTLNRPRPETVGVDAAAPTARPPGATPLAQAATAAPATAAPATAAPATAAPAPTARPTTAPAGTVPTTAPATVGRTPASTAAPPTVAVERGTLLMNDSFDVRRWADTSGPGWSVGYQGDRYRITAAPGIGIIWSYRSGNANDYTIGVDMQAMTGEGGLLLRFADGDNYLAYVVNPARQSYRLEQHSGGAVSVLASGGSQAIVAKPQAQNRLAARLEDGRVALFANGVPLGTFDASNAPYTPRYGLLAISGADPAEVYFDNMDIRSLE
jgi:DnaJ-domain-containing protein 1